MCCAAQTGISALEQQLKDLTLELQQARSERQAHQALHGAMTALERYQQDLLQAGAVAGLLDGKGRAGGGQEFGLLHDPEVSQPGPGFFVSFLGKVQSVATRLKQNVTQALIKGGFYSPTDEDLRRVLGTPQQRRVLGGQHRPRPGACPAESRALSTRPSPASHACRSFIVTADAQELHQRNAAARELLASLMLEVRGHAPARHSQPLPCSGCRRCSRKAAASGPRSGRPPRTLGPVHRLRRA